jgi:hypothetical protein
MNVQEYISSGIVETYVFGLATEDERRVFESLASDYPELSNVCIEWQKELEAYALAHAVEYKGGFDKILEAIHRATWSDECLQAFANNPDRINDLTSRQFEELAAVLLRRQGYEVTLTPATRDGGKDLVVAHHTGFGQLLYFVECKKYGATRKVGVEVLRQLYGTIAHDNITAGIIVTNAYFTSDALQWQRTVCYRLKLVDRSLLQQWLDEFRKGGKKVFGVF